MSRIGKKSIEIPAGVSVTLDKSLLTVKGPKGTLTQVIDPDIIVDIEGSTIDVKRPTEQKRHKALHGLYRSLINNCVVGVHTGYEIKLELVGVGYKATTTGNLLELSLGYSHGIFLAVPDEISIEAETLKGKSPTILLKGIDKQLLGQVAAKIKSLRPVEPYKGKGVRVFGEQIRRKAGKTASK